jgi:hypothetical protein
MIDPDLIPDQPEYPLGILDWLGIVPVAAVLVLLVWWAAFAR